MPRRLALLLIVPALAAWSPPQAVPGAPDSAPALRYAASGTGVLAADTSAGTPSVGPHTVGVVAAADGSFGAVAPLTATNFALGARFAPYAQRSIVALGTHAGSGGGRAGLAFGTAGAKLTDVRQLGPADRSGVAEALSANAAGDVAATFGACANAACEHQLLYLARRRAGASPDGSRRLDDTAISVSATAVNARGDLIAAWQGNGGVYARILTAGGTLYAEEHVANVGEPVRSLSVTLTPDRGAVLGWLAQDVGEGRPDSAATLAVAVKEAGASHTFHSAQTLETVPALGSGHYVSGPGVRVALAGDGRATAAWTGYADPHFLVRAATLASGGYRFGAPATLTDPGRDAILSDLAAGPVGGEAVAVVVDGLAGADPVAPGSSSVLACARAADAAAFSACAPVSASAGAGAEATDASVAYDPTADRPVVAWRAVGVGILTAHG